MKRRYTSPEEEAAIERYVEEVRRELGWLDDEADFRTDPTFLGPRGPKAAS